MENDLTELCLLAIKYGTDRHPRSKHSYTPYYYNLFKDKRQLIKKVLEFGDPEHTGLKMWRDFFPNATIFGVENAPGSIYHNEERIRVYRCNQSSKRDLEKLLKKIGSDFDIVIDDGSHVPQDQVLTCLTLMPHLKKSVAYIIEDVINPDIVDRGIRGYSHYTPILKPPRRRFNRRGQPYTNRIIVVRNKKGEKTSIIVPSRNESLECQPGITVLQRTVQDIYEKATGDFEVLVGFDGPPFQDFPDYPNLKVVKFPAVVGIKTMINALAAMSSGKYIYKTDAHCAFAKGFDEVLQSDMEENWIVTPRFYVLNPTTWEWKDERFYDYFYLCCPFTDPKGLRFKAGGHWPEKTKEKLDVPIDETPQIHGSGWFISKDYYFNALGGFPNIDPYGHAQEPIWLALKNWLAGGKVMVNKKTWYAHMHQQGNKRGYSMSKSQNDLSYKVAAVYWLGDKLAERKHDFTWFIQKFMPMPTWPKNWEKFYSKWRKQK